MRGCGLDLSQNRAQCRAVSDAGMNFEFHKNVEILNQLSDYLGF
jgi:hypothetical protein